MAVLPDLLAPGLTTIFCGSAVGAASVRIGAPYAGPGNKFWPMLAETGLTPNLFTPQEYDKLAGLGIGLTDINKTESGADSDLSSEADDPAELHGKIEKFEPAILAFTAKRPAQVFLRAVFDMRTVDYGLQTETIGPTRLFVLPSPSGLAIRYWDPSWWHRLADLHREHHLL